MAPNQSDLAAYERIIASADAALARWSVNNPMRRVVDAQRADALAKLGRA